MQSKGVYVNENVSQGLVKAWKQMGKLVQIAPSVHKFVLYSFTYLPIFYLSNGGLFLPDNAEAVLNLSCTWVNELQKHRKNRITTDSKILRENFQNAMLYLCCKELVC